MKKLCLAVLFCMLGMADAYAMLYSKSMYKTSCLPEMKEFRADVKEFLVESNDWDWRRIAKNYGLYELNVHTTQKKPQSYEETCVIDSIEYKMKFTPVFVRSYYGDYKMAVQLFAEKKYLGVLFPFGKEYDGIYDSVGIKKGKIFVYGCAYEGANRSECRYDYKELDMPEETSYELSLVDEDKVVMQKFNVIEFNCYEELEKAYVDLRSYKEGSVLPDNYYWLKDNPLVKCGDVTIKFDADGNVNIRNNKKFFNEFNLCNSDKQIYRIMFNPVKFSDVYIEYFDKKDLYQGAKRCFEKKDCFSSNGSGD